ncbi:hypothetical protein AVEN_267154-1 [Araneus ventricosus]|uniref:Uncharacterized protein n=1 Tax=Araneus ventricosus TaxID=182803 RepID=A0A4Y2NBF5_ARAVE|nr:hypothetical protein AVEN_267154-1 [Araneus ventricosus]
MKLPHIPIQFEACPVSPLCISGKDRMVCTRSLIRALRDIISLVSGTLRGTNTEDAKGEEVTFERSEEHFRHLQPPIHYSKRNESTTSRTNRRLLTFLTH